jgi:hypothetical protein
MSYYLLNSYCRSSMQNVVQPVEEINPSMKLTYREHTKKINTQTPEVFGPAFWFTLHNGTVHLPQILSPISANRIKGFLKGVPEMVPCTDCSEHARAFIEANMSRIDNIQKGEDAFRLTVDFHNYVNTRLNKPIMSYDTARALYKGGVQIKTVKYDKV